jgi:hypothetical protein
MTIDESVVYAVEHDFSKEEYYNTEKDSIADWSGDDQTEELPEKCYTCTLRDKFCNIEVCDQLYDVVPN